MPSLVPRQRSVVPTDPKYMNNPVYTNAYAGFQPTPIQWLESTARIESATQQPPTRNPLPTQLRTLRPETEQEKAKLNLQLQTRQPRTTHLD